VPATPARTGRWYIWALLAAVLLIAAAVVVPGLVLGDTPTVTPLTPTISPSPASVITAPPTIDPGMMQLALTVDNLNNWRASEGLPTLDTHTALTQAADEHVRYLRSLTISELESTNVYRNVEGHDDQFMAEANGYDGTVQMTVLVEDDDITLAHFLDTVTMPESVTNIGLASRHSLGAGKYYYVVFIGRS
jgi:hypothetical protein